jgi:hypothetical protein
MSKKFVSISSKNRLTGTPYNFNITLSESIQHDFFLKSVLMPLTYYNVSTANQSFAILDNLTQRIITIAPGMYNAVSIATAIQTAMTAASPNNFDVAFSQITGKMTFTSRASFTLQSVAEGLLPLIGFSAGNYVSAINGAYYASSSPLIVSLGSNLSVNVRINNCNTRLVDSNGFASNFNVPFTQSIGGGVELYQPDYSSNPIKLVFDSPQRSLNISLYDVSGKPLQILAEWEMLLEQVSYLG